MIMSVMPIGFMASAATTVEVLDGALTHKPDIKKPQVTIPNIENTYSERKTYELS